MLFIHPSTYIFYGSLLWQKGPTRSHHWSITGLTHTDNCIHSHTYRQFRISSSSNLHVFRQCEGTGAPTRIPHTQKNMHILHRKVQLTGSDINPELWGVSINWWTIILALQIINCNDVKVQCLKTTKLQLRFFTFAWCIQYQHPSCHNLHLCFSVPKVNHVGTAQCQQN